MRCPKCFKEGQGYVRAIRVDNRRTEGREYVCRSCGAISELNQEEK